MRLEYKASDNCELAPSSSYRVTSDVTAKDSMNWHEELMESTVVADRQTKSISAKDTFEQDVLLAGIEPMIRSLAEKTWNAAQKETRLARADRCPEARDCGVAIAMKNALSQGLMLRLARDKRSISPRTNCL